MTTRKVRAKKKKKRWDTMIGCGINPSRITTTKINNEQKRASINDDELLNNHADDDERLSREDKIALKHDWNKKGRMKMIKKINPEKLIFMTLMLVSIISVLIIPLVLVAPHPHTTTTSTNANSDLTSMTTTSSSTTTITTTTATDTPQHDDVQKLDDASSSSLENARGVIPQNEDEHDEEGTSEQVTMNANGGKSGKPIKLSGTVPADDAFEDNDDFASSKELAPGYSFRTGSPLGNYLVGNESDPDFYYIVLPSGYYFMIEIRYNNSEVNFDLFLYSAQYESSLIRSSTSPSSSDTITHYVDKDNTIFYIKVNASFSEIPNGLYPYELDIFLEDEFGANSANFDLYNNETTLEDAAEIPNPLFNGDVYENLSLPNTIRGNDTYQFIAWETNVVNVSLTVEAFTINRIAPVVLLAIYDLDQNLIDSNILISPNIKDVASLWFIVNTSSTYFIRVEFVDSNATELFYTLSLVIEDQHDGFSHANNAFSSVAAPIMNSSQETWTFTGQWASSLYPDYYKLQLNDAERIQVSLFYFSAIFNQLKPDIASGINLYLYNDSGMTELISSSVSTKDSEIIDLFRVDRSGTFYLFVNSTIPGLRYYNMTVTILGADDDFEENDGFSDAAQLPTDDATYDLFLIKNEWDTFIVTLGRGDNLNVTITFNSSKGNLDLYLYGGSLNPSSPLAYSNGVTNSKESVTYFNPDDVFHVFILINAPGGGGIAGVGIEYQLIIDVSVGDDRFEPNDEFNSAVPIGEGNFTGLLVRELDEDWYKIYLLAGERVNISVGFSNDVGDIDLYVVDRTNGIVSKSVTNGDLESVTFTALYEGLHYIRVTLFTGSVNSYWLSISYPDELVEPTEDNDALSDAHPLTQGLHENLNIRIGDADYYAINVTQPGQALIIFASYDHSLGDLILELYHPNGSLLASDEIFGASVDYIPATELPNPDTYYLVVKLNDEPGYLTYALNITLAEASSILTLPPISFVPFPSLTSPLTLVATTLGASSGGLDLGFVVGAIGAGSIIGASAVGGGALAMNKIRARRGGGGED